MPDQPRLTPGGDVARVFFALWPDEATADGLDRAAARLHRLRGGRRTRRQTIHLTLVFLGGVERSRLADLATAAARVRGEPFEWVLDRADCWPRNRIAFLTGGETPPALLTLVKDLEDALAGAGFAFDRRPYKAHITLLRHADCAKENPALEPMTWAAREFVLVESVLGAAGAAYATLARFPLG